MSPRDKEAVQELFTRYSNRLGLDLKFQHFEEEINDIPGKYDEVDGGALFMAETATSLGSKIVGRVCLRRIVVQGNNWGELKRLYTDLDVRKLGPEDQVVGAIIQGARSNSV